MFPANVFFAAAFAAVAVIDGIIAVRSDDAIGRVFMAVGVLGNLAIAWIVSVGFPG